MRRYCTQNVWTYLLIAAISVFISCDDSLHDNMPAVSEGVEVGIYAGGVRTRTEMLPDGLSAVWASDDIISVWAKNSGGALKLNNQKFHSYGLDGSSGYFTSTLASPMEEGTYTYYCSYPAPASVNGMRATFTLPAIQDGKASGGADIMISDPVTAPALNATNVEGSDYNKVSFNMNRMTHHFRFWIPKGENHLGEDIQRIDITMPYNIAGNFIANLDSPKTWSDLGNGTKTITLNLAEPLSESDYDLSTGIADFAYAVIYPDPDRVYGDSDYMEITVYGNSSKSTLDPISLSGRTFRAGHSTPVRLLPKSPDIYCSINVKTGLNNIGEPLWAIKISSDGKEIFRYDNTSGTYHYIDYTKEYHGTSGKTQFDAVVNAVASGKAMLNFETNHASVDIPMTADMMVREGNSAVLNLGDVPYLLYEDFSTATAKVSADAYNASTDSDTVLDGYLLNDALATDGWNASRFGLIAEDCIRINCRFEGWAATFARYCGRLDTPALKWLKPNTTATVVVEFDKAFSIPVGYNMNDSAIAKAKYHVGYHTKSESVSIKGVNSNNISGNSTIVYTSGLYASENVGNMSNHKVEIGSAGNTTRIVFYVDTDRTKPDKTAWLGNNSCYYLYLDNIKVYIKN